MEKTILIGDKPVKFKATASTTRKYRAKFHGDMLLDMSRLLEAMQKGDVLDNVSLESFENIAYIMAKQADDSIPGTADEWLDTFDMFSIYQILPQIIELWGVSTETLETNKKK